MSSSVFRLLATQGLGRSLFFRSQLLLSPCAAVRRNCKVPCGGWDCGSFDLWGQKLKYHLGQHSVLGSKAGNRFRAPSVSNQSQRWVKIFLGAVEGWHLFLGQLSCASFQCSRCSSCSRWIFMWPPAQCDVLFKGFCEENCCEDLHWCIFRDLMFYTYSWFLFVFSTNIFSFFFLASAVKGND